MGFVARGIAALLALLLSPIFAAISLALRVSSVRSAFFKQERAGKDGQVFVLVKFKTMRDPMFPGEDDSARITSLGAWLRRSSVDELPSLWNVIRGELAFVGPRPLLPEYTDHYSSWQRRRLEVRPGITGLAQVSGRNALTWDEKFALDVWYVEHKSLALDIRILWRTLRTVVSASGVSHEGHATMPRFEGSEKPPGASGWPE